MKYRHIPVAMLMASTACLVSCTHVQLLGPQDAWTDKVTEFADYSLTVPRDPRWWVVAADAKAQTMFLVVPAAGKTREVLTDGKPTGMVLIQASGGPSHPDAYTLYDATIDLFIVHVPDGLKDQTAEAVVAGYLHDDATLYLQAGMISTGSQYNVSQVTFGSRDYTFSQLKLDKPAGSQIYVACAVFNKNNSRYLLGGRLWSSKSFQQDFSYLGSLLANTIVKTD